MHRDVCKEEHWTILYSCKVGNAGKCLKANVGGVKMDERIFLAGKLAVIVLLVKGERL